MRSREYGTAVVTHRSGDAAGTRRFDRLEERWRRRIKVSAFNSWVAMIEVPGNRARAPLCQSCFVVPCKCRAKRHHVTTII